mmetsp:Transcript_1448/g.3560  ORF Transcript_1448/g.3560 Transcript_1448/m.3560 type:complete len:221 (+) Transcript_1448:749-1411(+)
MILPKVVPPAQFKVEFGMRQILGRFNLLGPDVFVLLVLSQTRSQHYESTVRRFSEGGDDQILHQSDIGVAALNLRTPIGQLEQVVKIFERQYVRIHEQHASVLRKLQYLEFFKHEIVKAVVIALWNFRQIVDVHILIPQQSRILCWQFMQIRFGYELAETDDICLGTFGSQRFGGYEDVEEKSPIAWYFFVDSTDEVDVGIRRCWIGNLDGLMLADFRSR